MYGPGKLNAMILVAGGVGWIRNAYYLQRAVSDEHQGRTGGTACDIGHNED